MVRAERNGLRGNHVIMLRRAVQATTACWQERITELTPPQYTVLLALEAHPHASLTEVTALTMIDSATLTPLVSRLVERGLLTRTTDPASARRKLLGLTAEGAAVLKKVKPLARAAEKASLEVLSADEREQLLALTTKVVDHRRGRPA
ncbi:MarR family transcriptional regulator [Amycolatopsis rhabdoformis]|uniref:MarR family transcriptional regulator n=1 Tax=Amycolatopsis rhabdoformis TaxID=1448059 RepID=A0ABZ1I7M6_9PSEU|nr:MarR family transcriptional regulator [Amycolatopsis rhabdoformis]WSE30434.1 MarR family transcriptional regulator [Amycolatopsis rhabdoformis]